jgi:hypothetical protein
MRQCLADLDARLGIVRRTNPGKVRREADDSRPAARASRTRSMRCERVGAFLSLGQRTLNMYHINAGSMMVITLYARSGREAVGSNPATPTLSLLPGERPRHDADPSKDRAQLHPGRFKPSLTGEHTRPFRWHAAAHVTIRISSRSNDASLTAIIRRKAPWATRQSCHPRSVSSDDPVDVRPKVAALGPRRPVSALCRYRQWW